MKIDIREFLILDNEVLDVLESLEKEVFENPYSREKLEKEITSKTNFILLVAFLNEEPIAFKAGYQLTNRLFYSWIGGTIPSKRGHGIAKKLMAEQHKRIKELGFSYVRTHTENKYRSMLILNINSGFDIIGVFKSDHDEKQTIMLEMKL